ncbi:hypothetical protein WH47_00232 [Habropoda laboriosa]|uniref:Uncharacterized protein n=1 Tax=Habropoda laboriosa TaxID=597456 RepID=A0A0L7R1K8_9HYME|nr:hypothetical protein WH47_00232 [Habropoda laboriosa]
MCKILSYLQVIFYKFSYFNCSTLKKKKKNAHVIIIFKVLSTIMVFSWVGGSVLLVWRVIMINDFRILNVKIYEVKTE